ncbi:MTR10 [Candida pseudojiufengensis]|uniref:MTR10 n=1 Tax=Candida pseudojiufengensis TaxID=497109 RepID=UPI0022249A10|nr:MTR10 [Candida pseudojiufengensis]KAI5964099.1 MTR10 [Candida pseudojiufengensis]
MSSQDQTLQQLDHALTTMYSNAPREEKASATNYLETFQKSNEAWNITHQILQNKNEDNNSHQQQLQIFAAQTLRSKVIYDLLSQIQPENYSDLKNSILQLIKLYNSPQDKLIRTQLSIALSQLALQYLSWNDAINEILSNLSTNESILILLEFLKILPEEISDVKKSHLTDEEYNERSRQLISDQVETVIGVLKNLAEGNTKNDQQLNSAILDALNSWITECPVDQILTVHSLTSLIFQSLSNDATFDKAIECLVTIIRETRDIDNYEIIDALYQQILQLNSFMQSNTENLEDPEKVDGLTRLYVECGESWHALIAKNPKHFKPLVEILLNCCKYDEDLDVVKYTFQFWYLLKQLIVLPKFEEARYILGEVYLQLISVIIKHLTYPIAANDNDLFNGDKEQEDKFKDFRYEMGDVLKDCCAVVGATKALQVPFEQIQSIISNSSGHWQYLEAPLFSMRTMAKEVSTKEKTILPTIMSFLVKLPEHPKVRYAATLVLGRYTEWTSKHPEFLEPQLNYITKGFEVANNNNDIMMATSHALMYFCQDCSSLLVNYLEQLYVLYGQVRNQIDLESNYELIDGLAHVVSKVPEENLYKTSEMFLEPTLESINKFNQEDNNSEELNLKISDQIEVITVFIDVLKINEFEKPTYPVATLFIEKIWPLITSVLNKRASSIKISEKCMKLMKSAMLSFSSYLNSILPQFAEILHHGYQQTQFGCYLWVSGVVIRVYGDEEINSKEITNAVLEFSILQCQTFFQQLKTLDSNNNVKQIPDVIEDFYRMMNDLLMFYPFEIIPNLDLLHSVFEATIITLTKLDEYNPIISCIHFNIDLISWGLPHPPISLFEDKDTEPLKNLIKEFLVQKDHGYELLKSIINGLIFKFHIDIQQDANDLILKILIVSPNYELSIKWLNEIVINLPNIHSGETDRLIQTIGIALQNKDNRRIRSALKDFIGWYSRKNVTRTI